jgi:hypothetical protein
MKIPFHFVLSTCFGLLTGNLIWAISQEPINWFEACYLSFHQFVAVVLYWMTARKTPDYLGLAAIYSFIGVTLINVFNQLAKDDPNWKRCLEISLFQAVAIFVMWISFKLYSGSMMARKIK